MALAPSTLGAGREVSSCFQLKFSIVSAPKTVSALTVSRSMSGVVASGPSAFGWRDKGDVHRCEEDVEVLGVHDERQEGPDDNDIQVDEDCRHSQIPVRPSGASTRPIPWDANAHQP